MSLRSADHSGDREVNQLYLCTDLKKLIWNEKEVDFPQIYIPAAS